MAKYTQTEKQDYLEYYRKAMKDYRSGKAKSKPLSFARWRGPKEEKKKKPKKAARPPASRYGATTAVAARLRKGGVSEEEIRKLRGE